MATYWIKFTKDALTDIEPPEKSKDTYRDTENKRLALRVTKNGVKSFYLVRKAGRRVEWVFLGRFPEMPVAVARKRCEALNAEFVSGSNPAEKRRQERQQRRSEPTLGYVWKLYRKAYIEGKTKGGGRSPKTLDSQWTVWLSRWENKRLPAITDSMVESLRDEIGGKRSTTTANKIIAFGRALYNFAARSKRIKYAGPDPFKLVDKFPEKEARKARLRKSQVPKFFAALATVSEDMQDFFQLCLFVGARAGNIRAMRWRDLDTEEGVWHIPHSKAGSYEASLPEPALAILSKRRRKVPHDCEWVFPARSRSGHLESYRKAWLRVCKAAGIEELRLHDQRRTLSSWAQEAGAAVALVQAQLGHRDAVTTLKHYTQFASKERRTVIDEAVKAIIEASEKTQDDGAGAGTVH